MEIIVKELTDYTGPLLPELNFDDFSHDTLVKILAMYAKLYIALDGFWYMTVMERNGNDEALACDIQAWTLMSKYEKKRISETLNIKGNDVLSFMKTLQISPWFIHTKYHMDMKDNNNATLTVTHCPTLDALEKEGKGRQKDICGIFEPKIFKNYASLFSPNMEVRALSPLPRENRQDICCSWSFGLKT